MYGASILCMNHMELLRSFYSTKPGEMYVEKEMTYDKPLPITASSKDPPGSPPRIDAEAAGRQILQDLGMDGAHWADAKRDGSQVTIRRNAVTAPPADHIHLL